MKRWFLKNLNLFSRGCVHLQTFPYSLIFNGIGNYVPLFTAKFDKTRYKIKQIRKSTIENILLVNIPTLSFHALLDFFTVIDGARYRWKLIVKLWFYLDTDPLFQFMFAIPNTTFKIVQWRSVLKNVAFITSLPLDRKSICITSMITRNGSEKMNIYILIYV